MSDLQPAAFSSWSARVSGSCCQDFLQNPKDVDGTATALEAAAKGYGG